MTRQLPPLYPLRAFVTAARHMSFTAAAKELSVSQSAVSHEVKALENYYGTALFRRARSGLSLTREGKRLYGKARNAFEDLSRLGLARSDFETSGTVTLASPPLFCANWLMPRIDAFSRHYPAVDFRIINATEDRPELVREVDLMVVWDTKVPKGMRGELLLTISLSPVASPALFGANRLEKSSDELRNYRILHEGDTTAWEIWCEAAGLDDFEPQQQWILDDPALMIEATVKGHGIGMGAFPLIEGLIAEGNLIKPFEDEFVSERKYFLVRPKDVPGSKATRAFYSWVRTTVGDRNSPD